MLILGAVEVGVGAGGPSQPTDSPALTLPSPQGPRPHTGAGPWGACLGGGIFLWRRVDALTMWVIMTTGVTGAYSEETIQLHLQAEWADVPWELWGHTGWAAEGAVGDGQIWGCGVMGVRRQRVREPVRGRRGGRGRVGAN